MDSLPSVVILSFIPSPYQVELFDAVHDLQEVSLTVLYAARGVAGTPWSERAMRHEHRFVHESGAKELAVAVERSDLCVVSWYREPAFRQFMRARKRSGKPWCFWSERPGFRYSGLAGQALRRLMLWPLWSSDAPIWGIGKWAIHGYRKEFAGKRRFLDVPYFSDLSRFRAVRNFEPRIPRHVLYSGSLIHRKGIDVLARAWRRVSPRFPSATLHFVGAGAMSQQLAKILAPVDRTVSLLGPADWDDVPDIYRTADVLCAPSRYDGWGLIVPEALAAGLPVVASSSMGSSREMLVEGRQGWFVPPGDVASLESKLSMALSLSASEYSAMSQAASETGAQFDVPQGSRLFVNAARETMARFSRSS